MTTVQPEAPSVEIPTVELQCMEIWGGMEAAKAYVAVPGIDAFVYAQPHGDSQAGGDIHYLSLCGGGNISRFMLADVAGHGQDVAEVARRFRKLMRRYINTPDQARLARGLNQAFESGSAEGHFATALLATYFAPSDHLILVNAGHPRPLLYSAARQTWTLLDDHSPCCADKCPGRLRNLPLGVIDQTHYSQFAVPLEPSDLVICYTDWLIEAADPSGRQLGEQGLLKLVSGLEPAEPPVLGRRLLEAVQDYRGGGPPQDDLTLIVMHHNAADPPPHTLRQWMGVMARMAGLVPV